MLTYEELYHNIALLEEERKKKSEFYLKIIKGGISYFPYEAGGNLYFAPSKYLGNPVEKIDDDYFTLERERGFETNTSISNLVGSYPVNSNEIFALFEKFYGDLTGENPKLTGSFGRPRKFWETQDALDFVARDEIANLRLEATTSSMERTAIIEARTGQGLYRARLLDYWNSACAVTGCDLPTILIASHIKPWSESDNDEKIDVYNGLLLSPTYDKLFDRFLISFSESGGILISKLLSKKNRQRLGVTGEEQVPLAPEHMKYIRYHNAQFEALQG